MKLLLLDTCGQDGSVALFETKVRIGVEVEAGLPTADPEIGAARIVVERVLPGRSSSERLFPELRSMLEEVGWAVKDLSAIGVVSGPGSFTGVRVAVAAAKGLCEAGGVPLVMVSRLEVLARKVGHGEGIWNALLDAGRGEFFYGRFGAAEVSIELLLGRVAVFEAVRSDGAAARIAVCEESVLSEVGELRPVMTSPLLAADALSLVLGRIERGASDDVAASDANYLRRTDLEMLRRLEQRPAQGSGLA